MKILVIGSGAREHALCWRIKRSPSCTTLFCTPGNAGIAHEAECLTIAADDIAGLVAWCVAEQPDLVVVGPDNTLELGIADRLHEVNIPCFGPTRAAAQIEWSKAFMKDLAREAGIPTAAYGRFTDLTAAETFINGMTAPIVVKADGLALGKGVLICQSRNEALNAARDMLSGELFGKAGAEIVVEEFLHGFEVSYFALVDGDTVVPLASAQDHKRAFDGDKGPNTGGMGAISPAPHFDAELEQLVLTTVMQPLARTLVDKDTPYRGVVFAGLMIQDGKPVLIEFNARFGDPETQSIMRRWADDPVPYLLATAKGELDRVLTHPQMSGETALGVFMAAKGYPDAYKKRTVVRVPDVQDEHVTVFHASTALENGHLVNMGGRTLTVVATAQDPATAQKRAYAFVDQIDWPEGFCRRDIGWRALA